MSILRTSLMALLLAILASCVTTVHPAVGVWDLSMDTPLGDIDADLIIERDGDGRLQTQDFGTSPIRNVVLTGNDVVFATTNPQGQAMTFRGTVMGNSMVGEFSTDSGSFPATGIRR